MTCEFQADFGAASSVGDSTADSTAHRAWIEEA
jgi:hypothetical protein